MKTKKWKIKMEFDWYAWEEMTKRQVEMVTYDFVPQHVENVIITVEENDE